MLATLAVCITSVTALASCNPFIFIGQDSTPNNPGTGDDSSNVPSYVPYEGTNNAIFFALYNYYGHDGQHFTNRWLGMKDALDMHGITVTGDAYQKDARKFKIERREDSDLPEDAKIYMVNNQTWDTNLQLTKPLTKYKPMALISTCNGVEFCSAQIQANCPGTQNATMGGFSKNYRKAFEEHTLNYLATKYSCHVAPIFAAGVDAARNGKNSMRAKNGKPLRFNVKHWDIKSLEEYDECKSFDSIGDNPTIKKTDLDPFFEQGNPLNSAAALEEWCSQSSIENIKSIYEKNRDVVDVKDSGERIKVGLLVPGSVNEVVQAYIDYMEGYLADVYNVEMLPKQMITSTNTQQIGCKNLINAGAKFIVSLQDDTNRNSAIELANERGVYFANAGTAQNNADFAVTEKYEYFVGSVGSTIEEERRVTREMTDYYLNEMIRVDAEKKAANEGK